MELTSKKEQQKKKFTMPHILVMITLLILVFCALTYILPGGTYDLDENGRAIAGTFQSVSAVHITPWQALLYIQNGLVKASSIISLLLICGGSIEVVLSTGCFEEVLNASIYHLKDKSVKILVPSIIVLMSLLGAFAGNDSLIAFVAVGIIICGRLHLDRICAMAMFYLGYLIGQGASLTSAVLITVQSMAGVEPLSDIPIRIPIWCLFTAINAFYCTRYALKVAKDPSKSILGTAVQLSEDAGELKKEKFPLRAIITILVLFGCYIFYAFGATKFGWDLKYLVALIILAAIFAGVIYRINPNDVGKRFFKGAQGMGGICVVLGLARVIGSILTDSNMVYAFANAASNIFGKLGMAGACLAIFVFIMLFNLLVPSATSKAAILLPLICPIADVFGISRNLIVVIYMMGDSLTNTLTPVSGPLCGSLGLADVEYMDWIKYAAPLMGFLAVVGGCIIVILSKISWA